MHISIWIPVSDSIRHHDAIDHCHSPSCICVFSSGATDLSFPAYNPSCILCTVHIYIYYRERERVRESYHTPIIQRWHYNNAVPSMHHSLLSHIGRENCLLLQFHPIPIGLVARCPGHASITRQLTKTQCHIEIVGSKYKSLSNIFNKKRA